VYDASSAGGSLAKSRPAAPPLPAPQPYRPPPPELSKREQLVLRLGAHRKQKQKAVHETPETHGFGELLARAKANIGRAVGSLTHHSGGVGSAGGGPEQPPPPPPVLLRNTDCIRLCVSAGMGFPGLAHGVSNVRAVVFWNEQLIGCTDVRQFKAGGLGDGVTWADQQESFDIPVPSFTFWWAAAASASNNNNQDGGVAEGPAATGDRDEAELQACRDMALRVELRHLDDAPAASARAASVKHAGAPRPDLGPKPGDWPDPKDTGGVRVLPERFSLNVTVCGARDLPAADFSGWSDPYCRVRRNVPDDGHRRTKTLMKTLAPKWEEGFAYHRKRRPGDELRFEV
jgi:hypothetical protein